MSLVDFAQQASALFAESSARSWESTRNISNAIENPYASILAGIEGLTNQVQVSDTDVAHHGTIDASIGRENGIA